MTASGASVTFDPSNPRQRIAFPNKSLRLKNTNELIKTRQNLRAFVPEQACGQEKESNCEVVVESKYAVVDLCSTKKVALAKMERLIFYQPLPCQWVSSGRKRGIQQRLQKASSFLLKLFYTTALVLFTIKLSRDIQLINYAIHAMISGLYVSPSATDVIL